MVCPYCSRKIADGSKKCEYCGLTIETEAEPEKQEIVKPRILLGTLGALLGAVLGGALLFFACRLGGILGSVAGISLAFCIIKGYHLLGRRMNAGGIMISMALVALTAYFADRLDWAFRIAAWQAEQVAGTGEAQLDVLTSFLLVPTLLDAGNIDLSSYLTNLAVVYVFCALGAYFTLSAMMPKKNR